MDAYLIWVLVGIGFIIADLVPGTFYLLFLGIAALVSAAAAYFNAPFSIQAVIAAVVAIGGVLWAHHRSTTSRGVGMEPLDVGQPVVIEAWVDQAIGLARVKYRGATWDARVEGELAPEIGDMLYVIGVDGSTLRVIKRAQS